MDMDVHYNITRDCLSMEANRNNIYIRSSHIILIQYVVLDAIFDYYYLQSFFRRSMEDCAWCSYY